MSLVFPILFFVVGVGLFAKRITPRIWMAVACWIALVIAVQFARS